MKLLSTIESYVALKRALGAVFSVDARILRSFGRTLGDISVDAVTSEGCREFCRGNGVPTRFWESQMDHKPWTGVAFYDLIFPLFVFIVGASLVFSVSRMIERDGKAAALKRIFVRSLLLYFLGLFFYDGLAKGIEHIRWMGVLQRIALAYFFAGLIFCFFRLRGMAVICATCWPRRPRLWSRWEASPTSSGLFPGRSRPSVSRCGW